MLTLREWANLDTAKSRKKFQDFLTLKMQPYSDVLSVAEASRFTGYHHNTFTNWCHREKQRPPNVKRRTLFL